MGIGEDHNKELYNFQRHSGELNLEEGQGARLLQRQIVQFGTGGRSSLGKLETTEHILYECKKYEYNSLRDRLRDRALVEGVIWPPRCISGCERIVTGTYVRRVLGLREDKGFTSSAQT